MSRKVKAQSAHAGKPQNDRIVRNLKFEPRCWQSATRRDSRISQSHTPHSPQTASTPATPERSAARPHMSTRQARTAGAQKNTPSEEGETLCRFSGKQLKDLFGSLCCPHCGGKMQVGVLGDGYQVDLNVSCTGCQDDLTPHQ